MEYEGRRSPRYPLIAPAEVIEVHTATHLSARTSDVSLVGCHVNAPNSFLGGTEVRLHVVYNDRMFTALGIVIHGQPNTGMGINSRTLR